MGTINDIIQVTHNDHLNYYELHTTKKTGEPGTPPDSGRQMEPGSFCAQHSSAWIVSRRSSG